MRHFSPEQRCKWAEIASEAHFLRTGKGLDVTLEAVSKGIFYQKAVPAIEPTDNLPLNKLLGPHHVNNGLRQVNNGASSSLTISESQYSDSKRALEAARERKLYQVVPQSIERTPNLQPSKFSSDRHLNTGSTSALANSIGNSQYLDRNGMQAQLQLPSGPPLNSVARIDVHNESATWVAVNSFTPVNGLRTRSAILQWEEERIAQSSLPNMKIGIEPPFLY